MDDKSKILEGLRFHCDKGVMGTLERLRRYSKDGDNKRNLLGQTMEEAANIIERLLNHRHSGGDGEALMKALQDSTTLHTWMLRGLIPIPSWRSIVDLRGEVPNGEDRQLSRIAELQDKVSADGEDAARYRWLRKSVSNPAYCVQSGQWGQMHIHSEALDAAVDKARAGERGVA